jgi:two-component system cell cycle response regulator CpdR
VPDGQQALQRLTDERFDLLLTDIRMPGMDGFELARRAKAAVPGLCVLYMSGFAREYRIDPAHEDFISKPFRRGELLGCVYEITARPHVHGRRPLRGTD